MDSIGGYRIIRKLGSGSRSEVFLAGADRGPGQRPHLAAVKLFRAAVPVSSIESEIAALSGLDCAHIVRLHDLASGPDGRPCLILQRLEPGGLARLLMLRENLRAGEAVTILAPLVEAVGRMHRAGVVHGDLGASAVLFDETGAPVLTGFGAAGLIESSSRPVTPAELDLDAGVGRDLDRLQLLAAALIARVHDSPTAAEAFAHWLDRPRTDAARYATELQEQVFALAAPLPVEFAPDPDQHAVLPRRWDAGAATGGVRSPAAALSGRAVLGDAPRRPRVPPLLLDGVARGAEWVRRRLPEVRAGMGRVRRRVWAVAGLGGVAVVAAVVLAPIAGSEPPQPAAVPVAPALDSGSVISAIGGDDPVAAARELLAARAACLLDRSVLCLDGVDQPESAVWKADAARIREIQQGAELGSDGIDDGTVPVLVERMGDSALVALLPGGPDEAQPGIPQPGILQPGRDAPNAAASVLMIKTEAGWRFRSLLTAAEPLVG